MSARRNLLALALLLIMIGDFVFFSSGAETRSVDELPSLGAGADELTAIAERRGEFMFGIDGTMTEALKRWGLKWYSEDGIEVDPLTALGRMGVTWFRMGITTNKTGSMRLENPAFYGPKEADLWQPFSLFDESGRPKSALSSFESFALTTPELAQRMLSRNLILDAWEAISLAERTGRSVKLDRAIENLNEAVTLYLDSKYDAVVAPAAEAKRLAEAAASPAQEVGQVLFVVTLVAVIVTVCVLLFRRAKKHRLRTTSVTAVHLA